MPVGEKAYKNFWSSDLGSIIKQWKTVNREQYWIIDINTQTTRYETKKSIHTLC